MTRKQMATLQLLLSLGVCLHQVLSQSCGGRFIGSSGRVTSPNYPSNYGNNLNCYYYITVPTNQVRLSFRDFLTESGADYVRIHDGASTSSPLIGQFSGSSTPRVLTTSTRYATVYFRTDGSVVRRGWDLYYSQTSCGGSYSGSSGRVVSPNYPHNYNSSTTCTYSIRVPSNKVLITFNDFVTETNYDYLEVFDGASSSSPSLGRFHGVEIPPQQFGSGNTMYMVFRTDGSAVRRGWGLTYSSYISGSLCECQMRIESECENCTHCWEGQPCTDGDLIKTLPLPTLPWLTNTSQMTCFYSARPCKHECEVASHAEWGDGLHEMINVGGSSISRGQYYCQRMNRNVFPPGLFVISTDSQSLCQQNSQTFRNTLFSPICCLVVEVIGVGESPVWDFNCNGSIDPQEQDLFLSSRNSTGMES